MTGVRFRAEDGAVSPSAETSANLAVAILVEDAFLQRQLPFLRRLALALSEEGVGVVFLARHPDVLQLGFGPVEARQYTAWSPSHRLQRHIQELARARAIQLTQVLGAGLASRAMAAGEKLGLKTVVMPFGEADLRLCFRQSPDAPLLAPCPYVEQRIRKEHPRPAVSLRLIRPGIPTGGEAGRSADSVSSLSIAWIGSFTRDCGLAALIDAVAGLNSGGRDILVFVHGFGPEEWTLRERIRSLRQDGRFVFVGEGVPIEALLKGADVLIDTSEPTALRLENLQAMGLRTMIVARRNSFHDFQIPDETAVVAETVDPQVLRDIINRLRADPADMIAMAERALEYVKKHHGMARMAVELAAWYAELSRAADFSPHGGPEGKDPRNAGGTPHLK